MIRWLALLLLAGPAGAEDLAFITSQNAGAVSVVDLGSGQVRAELPLPGAPAPVAYDPAHGRAYVIAAQTGRLSVLDEDGRLTLGLDLPEGAFGLAVAPDGGVFVTEWYQGRLIRLDADLRETWSVPTGKAPAGVATDGALVATADRDDDQVSIYDAGTGALRARVAVGRHPYAVLFHGGRIWTADVQSDTVSVIDREELASKVYKGTYTPMYSYIPDGLAGHEDTLKSAYGENGKPSVDKAKKALSDAGVKTPVTLKIQYNADHYGASSSDEYAAIKSQLETGGLFKVDLQQTEWTQYSKERVVTDSSDGSYPLYQLGWFPDYSDPDNYLSPFFREGNFILNAYSNKEVDSLISKQAGELDQSKREDELKQIQKIVTGDVPTIPLLQGAQVAVTGKNVKNVILDASFRFRYASVTKS